MKESIQQLKNDIKAYTENILKDPDNILNINQLKEELNTVCEYMMALCDLVCNSNIQSDFLGISSIINNKNNFK